MPRRRLIKLPFFKTKINRQSIFNIFGFFTLASAFLSALSLIKRPENEGKFLAIINNFLINKFGNFSFFIPFILLFLGLLFFNSKKIKFIKGNIFLGLILIFISFLGLFQSGEAGGVIFNNLATDFTSIGAYFILLIIFLVGLILFFDTSVDAVFYFLFSLLKASFNFIKNYIFRESWSFLNKDKKEMKKKEVEFIGTEKGEIKIKEKPEPIFPKTSPITNIGVRKKLIDIKPLSNFSGKNTWIYPPLSILNDIDQKEAERGDVKKNAQIIEETLDSFGIQAKVVDVNYGPTVTQYAIRISKGTKLSKI
ncbi:MAG: DNA translocase FtsK, partial [Microgenomates group bacterium]